MKKESKRKILKASVLQLRLMQNKIDIVYIIKILWRQSEIN